ncbi:MAG: hypothetical protein L0Y73_04700, partial [Candidatus Aminicenantes bacterium]|nr:hypothetical protein [Candidatus Aminicenantes bacterium]
SRIKREGEKQMNKIIFGIVIPALVFIFSFVITWLLYRHFARGAQRPAAKVPDGTSAGAP